MWNIIYMMNDGKLNMKEINETDIHLFVLNPDLVNREILSKIEFQIKTDENLRNTIEELKEFYKNFNELYNSNLSTTFYLEKSEKNEVLNFKLAALNKAETFNEIKYLNTYVNAEKLILTRIFYNPSENVVEFHVVSNEIFRSVPFNFRVTLLNSNIVMITDKYGISKLSYEKYNKDMALLVNIPISIFELNKSDFDSRDFVNKSSLIDQTEIQITKDEKTENYKCKLKHFNDLIDTRLNSVNNSKKDLTAYYFEPGDEENYKEEKIVDNSFSLDWNFNKPLRIVLFEH